MCHFVVFLKSFTKLVHFNLTGKESTAHIHLYVDLFLPKLLKIFGTKLEITSEDRSVQSKYANASLKRAFVKQNKKKKNQLELR